MLKRRNYRSARYHLNRAVSQLAHKPELQAKAQKALEQIDDTTPAAQKRKRRRRNSNRARQLWAELEFSFSRFSRRKPSRR